MKRGIPTEMMDVVVAIVSDSESVVTVPRTTVRSISATIGRIGSLRNEETGIELTGDDPVERGYYRFVPAFAESAIRRQDRLASVTFGDGRRVCFSLRDGETARALKERMLAMTGIRPDSYVLCDASSSEIADASPIASSVGDWTMLHTRSNPPSPKIRSPASV
jgi:hypothetical protein